MGLTGAGNTSAVVMTAFDLSSAVASGSTMLANGQNSFNCSEESCNNPFADNYISLQDIYNLCSEEAGNMTLCACGCGQEITWKPHYKWKGIPKYIHGHNPSWNKGINYNLKHDGQFKKGQTPWNSGRKYKLKHSGQFQKGFVPWNKGIPFPQMIGNTHRKGKIPWNKDKKGLTPPNKGKKFPERSGKYHPNWKGGTWQAEQNAKRKKKGFILLTKNNPYTEPIEYHHIHPDLPYVIPCPKRIHQAFNGSKKTHFQNVNAMLGFRFEVN